MNKVKFLLVLSLVLFIPISRPMAWSVADAPLSTGTFGTSISNYGQIVIDDDGNVYVAGSTNPVNKYNSSGTLLTAFGASDMSDAHGVAIDPTTGNIFLASWDSTPHTVPGVFKYTNTGTRILMNGSDLGDVSPTNDYFILSYAAAVDSTGNVYISDWQGNGDADMVYKFSPAGSLIDTIFSNGGTSFNQISSIAVDGSDNLYVLDGVNARVQKFNSSGVFQLEIPVVGGGFLEGFTVDTDGNVYVLDTDNSKILIYDSSGTLQQQLVAADFGLGNFNYLSGIGINSQGILYVGDANKILTASFDRSTATIVIDAFTGNDTTDSTPTITGTSNDTQTVITNVEYSVDSGVWTACVPDDGTFDELSETFSCTVSPALTVGSHSIDIRATDSKSNTNSGATIENYSFDIVAATVVDSGSSSSSSNNSGSSNSSSGSVCVPLPSGVSPNIFSIVRTGTIANVFYSPVSSDATGYQLMYGYTPNDERFGVTFRAGTSTGAQVYKVDDLEANRKYYFWMRAVSDCSEPGPWSNTYELFTTNNYYSGIDDETLYIDEDSATSDTEYSATDSSQLYGSEIGTGTENGTEMGTGDGGDTEANRTTGLDGDTFNNGGPTDVKNMIAVLLSEPLGEAVSREIMMPVDASYVVKTGAVGVVANVVAASAITFITLSKTIFSSLSVAYKASSRSIFKMPSDYLSSLMKYSFMGFTSGFSPLLPFLGRKKNRNGVVFDAFSFKPLAKVYVILFSKSGNLKTDFSDHQGKYEFQNLAPDDYQMKAEIVGYKFPSQIITTSLSQVGNVYLPGNVITIINDQSKVPEFALPMDPSKMKKFMLAFNYKISGLLRILNPVVILLSSIIIIAAVYTNPSQFNQFVAIIFVLYLLGKVFLHKKTRKGNNLINNKTGRPTSNNSVLNQGANLSI